MQRATWEHVEHDADIGLRATAAVQPTTMICVKG